MEPLLVEHHEQGVEVAGGDHHQRHRPAEQREHGQFSVSVVNILLITTDKGLSKQVNSLMT